MPRTNTVSGTERHDSNYKHRTSEGVSTGSESQGLGRLRFGEMLQKQVLTTLRKEELDEQAWAASEEAFPMSCSLTISQTKACAHKVI